MLVQSKRVKLVTEVIIDVGTVDGLVASGAPARTALDVGVVQFTGVAGVDPAARADLAGGGGIVWGPGEVAAEAEVLVACDQHFLVHRAVGLVAGDTAFLHCAVFKHERSGLSRVALGARLVHVLQRCARALDGVALMDVVAIHATNLAGHHRMGVGQAELAAFVEVALEARLGRLAGVDDQALNAALFHVEAAGAMAGFATGFAQLRIGERDLAVR